MLAFLTRRLLQIVPTIILVSMLIFGLQQLLPGDPALIMAGEDQTHPVALEQGRELVTRLKQLADDPILCRGDDIVDEPADDPLLLNFRDTASMTESALRLVQAFPDSPSAFYATTINARKEYWFN